LQNSNMQLLLADAHPCSRIGLYQVLVDAGFEVVAEAEAVDDCWLQLAQHEPPLLLMACNLLPKEPIPLLANLRQQHPNCHIVLFLANCDTLPLQAIVDVGVSGMVDKEESSQTLLQVVQTAATGQIAISPSVMGRLLLQSGTSATLSLATITLDKSERALLRLICTEKSNAELAAALNVGKKTVERYLSLLYIKLGVQGRVGAAVWFMQYDDLEDESSED